METLIRCSRMLIWVCTVCTCPTKRMLGLNGFSDFIWPFLPLYMGVILNPKTAFIFSISCILALIFPIFMKYFPKCSGKGSFPNSQNKITGVKGFRWLRVYKETRRIPMFEIILHHEVIKKAIRLKKNCSSLVTQICFIYNIIHI